MGKVFIIFTGIVLLLFASCTETGYEKPENLIDEKKMADILYDMHLTQAIFNSTRYGYEKDSVNFTMEDLHFSVLQKHGVDDSTYYQSILYYSSLPKTYEKIYQDVINRMVMLEEEDKKSEAVKIHAE
jgi:hypothetical protein